MWEIKLKIANLANSGGVLCVFGSHKCLPISWMCRKQTAVSHGSAESEIISPDAVLRKMVYRLFNLGVRVKTLSCKNSH